MTAYFTYTSEPETDRFTFSMSLPDWFDVGHEMEFAVCYVCQGHASAYWDNNHGDNYRVRCLTRAAYALPSGCNPAANIPPLPWQQLI